MYCNCSPTLIRLLRRHLPRRGRHSAAAGMGGQGRPPLRVRRKIGGTGGQGRQKKHFLKNDERNRRYWRWLKWY